MKASELKVGDKILVTENGQDSFSQVTEVVNDGEHVHVSHNSGSLALPIAKEIEVQRTVVESPAPVSPPEAEL